MRYRFGNRMGRIAGVVVVALTAMSAIFAQDRESEFEESGYEKPGCRSGRASMLERVMEVVNEAPGTVGIAVVGEGDTLLVNNAVHYPMMSVFKLHQAIAVGSELGRRGHSLDSILTIRPCEIDTSTWSPMLRDFDHSRDFDVSVGQLLRYALTVSDNNASNILFSRVMSPSEVDTYIRSVAPDSSFLIAWSESEMKQDHERSYENFTTPLAAALLLNRFMTDGVTFSSSAHQAVREMLAGVTTGSDRLSAAALGNPAVRGFVHKTGSGYRNARRELMAHNDVGHFILSDGRSYTVAVFIRDFRGSESEASSIISRIARAVLPTRYSILIL